MPSQHYPSISLTIPRYPSLSYFPAHVSHTFPALSQHIPHYSSLSLTIPHFSTSQPVYPTHPALSLTIPHYLASSRCMLWAQISFSMVTAQEHWPACTSQVSVEHNICAHPLDPHAYDLLHNVLLTTPPLVFLTMSNPTSCLFVQSVVNLSYRAHH